MLQDDKTNNYIGLLSYVRWGSDHILRLQKREPNNI